MKINILNLFDEDSKAIVKSFKGLQQLRINRGELVIEFLDDSRVQKLASEIVEELGLSPSSCEISNSQKMAILVTPIKLNSEVVSLFFDDQKEVVDWLSKVVLEVEVIGAGFAKKWSIADLIRQGFVGFDFGLQVPIGRQVGGDVLLSFSSQEED